VGATRRIQAVVETLITRKGLNLRLAPRHHTGLRRGRAEGERLRRAKQAEQGVGRPRAPAGGGVRLLQLIKYPQGEAGFRADPSLLKAVAQGLGQQVNPAHALTPETIISSLSAGQTEGTVTIMFTDVEGSTQMLSSRGFTLSHEIMKAYESIIEEKIIEHAGRRIKGLGDGVMVSFGSTRHAGIECAIEIQRAIGEYSKQNPERKLKIRIGINTGEVVEEAGDIFGAAVNVAARVAGKARGGQILVSEVVRELVGPIAEIKFGYRGRYKLKGFPDRFRLHDVTPGEAPSPTPVLPTGDGFVGRDQERLDIRMALDRAATGSGGMFFWPVTRASGHPASLPRSPRTPHARDGGCSAGAAQSRTTHRSLRSATCSPRRWPARPPGRCRTPWAPTGLCSPSWFLPCAKRCVASVRPPRCPPTSFESSCSAGVFEFLAACQGAKPLLVVLDDLQWADDETVLLLRDFAERLAGSRIVVLGTYWDELDSSRPFTTAASRLLRRRRAQRIELGRLSDREVEKMIAVMAATSS